MRSELGIIALGATLLMVSCGESKPRVSADTNVTPTNAAPPAMPAIQPGATGLTVSGPIIVEHQVEIGAQRDGLVAKIYFDAPARVKAGTVLAKMDDRQIAANLAAARAKSRSIENDLKNWQAEAEVLKADYGRQQRLWDLGLTSQEQLEHAKYKAESDQWDIKRVQETLNTAREEERSLELELDKTQITAPFSGVIARRYIREGQAVSKGERLFWVTAESPLLMRFTLPERYFGHVHQGQIFELRSPDGPEEKHTARVKEISPVVDPASGTFEVLVELTGERGQLRPGMTVNVQLESLK